MSNSELARVFDRIADLMEIDGQDGFRINSYRRTARTLRDTTEDVRKLAEAGELTKLPGVGKGTAERINQYLSTGKIDVLTELEDKFPAGLVDLLEIPGMGPKKAALAHSTLKVSSLADLKRVIDAGELAELPGMGSASVKKIAEGIQFLEGRGGRTPLGLALPIAEELAAQVRELPGVRRVEIAGSLRRAKETIGDVDLLCDTDDPEAAVRAFTQLAEVKRVLAAGGTKGSVIVGLPDGSELQVDLRAVAHESFGAAWQYFTGSKEHNVRLRELAIKKKLRLNEYGLHRGETMVAGTTEESIYAELGVPCVPPELREDRGEVDPAFEPPKLVKRTDIKGDLHMHTTASDGKHTIQEMAAAGRERGYKFIAICDHSKSSVIANGLDEKRMTRHIQDICAANESMDGIEILVGTECDILPDGSLDYPDDLLAQCDWVVASIHAAMGKGGRKLSPTERTLAAIENRYVCVIGHPTGRLINKRDAMELDMAAVVRAAAANHTFLEINASWQRLDLKDTHVRQALEAGVMLSINTDAHRTTQLDQMRFGVLTARRGGATPKDIVNCMTLAKLRKAVARKRS